MLLFYLILITNQTRIMITEITSIERYEEIKSTEESSLFYFSHDACNVCKVLKPKVEELLKSSFPKMSMHYVNTVNTPDIAAQQSILTVPTILVFLDGKEYTRKSRNIGLQELAKDIERPYNMMFE